MAPPIMSAPLMPLTLLRARVDALRAERRVADRSLDERAPTLPLAVFQLSGSQEEMGAQHGALLRDIGGWEETLAYYPRMVECIVTGKRDDALVGALQGALPLALRPAVHAALERLHKRRPAALRARTEAFYAALGLPAGHARYLGVMDVLQNLIGLAGRVGAGDIGRRAMEVAPPACSTLAIWGEGTVDGRLLHARNFDFPGSGVWEQAPTVVFCTPDEGLRYGFVATRGADVPAVSVFNEAGLSLTIHTRFHQDIDFSGALAVDLCHEVARTAETLDQATDALTGCGSASTWGVLVSSARERRGALVEMTARGAAVVRPEGDWISCTNRYRATRLQRGELEPSPGFLMHSDGRFEALERRARAAVGGAPVDPEALQALLGDHADVQGQPRAAGGVLAQSNGVHAVVIDPEQQAVDVAVGAVPTSHGPWVRVPWRFTGSPEVQTQDLQALRSAEAERHATSGHRYQRGPTGLAYRRMLEAARQEMVAGSAARADAALEEACRLDPAEPTYRLLAAGARLRAGDLQGAHDHLQAALEAERAPFYRARLLLWAARVADALGRPAEATRHRDALAAIADTSAVVYQRKAAAERRAPLPAARLKKTRVMVQLCDLAV